MRPFTEDIAGRGSMAHHTTLPQFRGPILFEVGAIAKMTGTLKAADVRGEAVSGPESLLRFDSDVFNSAFGRAPFLVGHCLASHPLFEFARLLELARSLPPTSVEYNAGNLAVNQDPQSTPRNGLSAEETIHRIEHCKSWMVLKNIEQDKEYRELLYRCLGEIEARGHTYARGICHREGFVFISSPRAVTPYHADPECNFLLQIRGSKQVSLFDGGDRSLLSEEELEQFYSGAHRNLAFKDEDQRKASVFELRPGDGLHFPVSWPHWVKVHDGVSISFSITFRTRATERREVLYQVNHFLRSRGRAPTPVGASRVRDGVKYNAYRVVRRVRGWLGRG
jgi:hypothetical protein